jgi:hypothetical protein
VSRYRARFWRRFEIDSVTAEQNNAARAKTNTKPMTVPRIAEMDM